MKYLSTKKLLSMAFLTALSLNACQQNKSKSAVSNKKANAESDTASKSQNKYMVVNTWLDDFKNFRTAVYQKDLQKIKTYFNFPVIADTTQVWAAIYNDINESKRPEKFPDTFTESDLEKQHDKLFNSAFVKSLLKVKSEQLYKTGEYTIPEINDGGQSYRMFANYDKATSTLQLSVSYAGGTDENGDKISETEYAVIYSFKVENNTILKFDKILFAG